MKKNIRNRGITTFLLVVALFVLVAPVYAQPENMTVFAKTTSDENGNYTFSNITAGNYTIEVAYYTPVMGGKWFTGSTNASVDDGEAKSGVVVWLSFGSEADALEIMNATVDSSCPSGTSTISGQTLAHGMGGATMTMTNATVLLIKMDESEDPPSQPENMTVFAKTTSDENGNYTFSNITAGNYTIEVAYYTPVMGGKWFTGSTNASVDDGEAKSGVVVWLSFGSEADALEIMNATVDSSCPSGTSTISGQTLAHGMGGATMTMTNATILLMKMNESEDPPSQPENMTVLAKTTSDENGNYTFSDLPAGDYVINVAYYTTAMGGKWFTGSNNTNVSAGEHRDGLDVWLSFGEEADALEIVNATVDPGAPVGTSTISGQTLAYDRFGSVRTMGNATVTISSYLKGDLNGDDPLTPADALIALQMAAGSREPDLVGDGESRWRRHIAGRSHDLAGCVTSRRF